MTHPAMSCSKSAPYIKLGDKRDSVVVKISVVVFLAFVWLPFAEASDCSRPQVALKDITACAEKGDKSAQYMLGQIYFYGKEVPRNYRKAFEWHSKAAEQRDKDAQIALAFAYYNGWGIRKDRVLAYMWLSLGIVNQRDEPVTQRFLASLEEELTPTELSKAQELASQWVAKHEVRARRRQ